jgi:peptidyl-prolyl cis-trans isomerase D
MVAEVRAGRSLAQVAAARGLTVGVAGPFARVEPNPVLGQANAAIGAAFGTPVGQVSRVVETPTGLFIIRPTQRVPADRKAWEAQKEQQRASVSYQMQQGTIERWLQSARRNAEIVDNRDNFGAS